MKNIIFIFAFMFISSFAFALSNEKVKTGDENLVALRSTTNKVSTSESKSTEEAICCTVRSSSTSATVCRGDGNDRRACRQARRLHRKAEKAKK